ncbi:MAG: hypothetical protein UMV23_07245 [Halanaerobium sp.]|nr:hypothetical protein [Halanaerobium sp.]
MKEVMTLNNLVSYVREIKAKRGFDRTSLEQEFILFSEEVGELAHEIWQVSKAGAKPEGDELREMGFEIVDCLIYLFSIAEMLGIEDLEAIFKEKEEINVARFE